VLAPEIGRAVKGDGMLLQDARPALQGLRPRAFMYMGEAALQAQSSNHCLQLHLLFSNRALKLGLPA